VDAEMLPSRLILLAVAVSGVAEDGVSQMSHMPSQLMGPPCPWAKFNPTKTGGRIAPHGIGQFDRGQSSVVRRSRLLFIRIALRTKGIVNFTTGINPSTDHGVVALTHLLFGEGLTHARAGRPVQGKQQNPAGRPIQPVTRMDWLADLIAQYLHGKLSRSTIQRSAVNQKASRLMDRHEMAIVVKNLECALQ
jgi:hypothetical protein